MNRVALKNVMMPRRATQQADIFGATRMGQGFAGGLRWQISSMNILLVKGIAIDFVAFLASHPAKVTVAAMAI